MNKRPDKTLPMTRFADLLATDERGERIWTAAPRSLFASDRDHRRWNERFAGRPLNGAEGAFRVRMIERPHANRRWHVEFAVGAQWFSLSSYDDPEEAEADMGRRLRRERGRWEIGRFGDGRRWPLDGVRFATRT